VGHETDTTLIDLAADLRAPTPTAAAELAVPVRLDLAAGVAGLDERRQRALARRLEEARTRLVTQGRLMPTGEALLDGPRQRLDRASEALPRGLGAVVGKKRLALAGGVAGQLSPALLRQRLAGKRASLPRLSPQRLRDARRRAAERLTRATADIARIGDAAIPTARDRLNRTTRLLEGLSYRATLARGFAVVRGADGAVRKRAAEMAQGEALSIEFTDGRVGAVADGGGGSPAPKPRRKRKESGGQGSLF
jgi:exodeoxyribonuclease VII large subunit